MNDYSPNRATIVDGRVVRDEQSQLSSHRNCFSWRRFLFVLAVCSAMIVTNPSNEVYEHAEEALERITHPLKSTTKTRRKKRASDWALHNILDPPISVTNYGLFTVEERHTAVTFLGLKKASWSCPFFDETWGPFCNAAANHFCHGRPLWYDPQSYAYTAHRALCFLIILAAILCFCCREGTLPFSEPLLVTIYNSVGRNHFSLFALALDLFNAGQFVYPALIQMEKVIPTLQEGRFAKHLHLPNYIDFILYDIILVLFVGGGCNAFGTFWTKQTCRGLDATVAASVAYCTAFTTLQSTTTQKITPQTIFWSYLPLTALLGGHSNVIAWLLAGMAGYMLGQYHFENQDLWLAVKQTVLPSLDDILSDLRELMRGTRMR